MCQFHTEEKGFLRCRGGYPCRSDRKTAQRKVAVLQRQERLRSRPRLIFADSILDLAGQLFDIFGFLYEGQGQYVGFRGFVGFFLQILD